MQITVPEDYVIADLDRLLERVPMRVATLLTRQWPSAVEVAFEVGQLPIARLLSGPVLLDVAPVSADEVVAMLAACGDPLAMTSWGGIEGTLDRIVPVRDRTGKVVGVTVRVGRHLTGVAEPLRPLLFNTRGSIVSLGPPGSGKTTLLRDCARILSERLGPAVLVVDSHGEIGGLSAVPHPAIGQTRRVRVPDVRGQDEVLLDAVRDRLPDVVVIDEIGSRRETDAVSAIARRGVRVIACCSGTLVGLVRNTDLAGLVGDPSRRPEPRKAAPAVMRTAIEVRRDRALAIYRDVAHAAAAVLAGASPEPDEIVVPPTARG